jgi:hypothetical protein
MWILFINVEWNCDASHIKISTLSIGFVMSLKSWLELGFRLYTIEIGCRFLAYNIWFDLHNAEYSYDKLLSEHVLFAFTLDNGDSCVVLFLVAIQ